MAAVLVLLVLVVAVAATRVREGWKKGEWHGDKCRVKCRKNSTSALRVTMMILLRWGWIDGQLKQERGRLKVKDKAKMMVTTLAALTLEACR